MPRPDRGNAIDHVVVLMFENRSFDNLLGRLYRPGEVASFEGVLGRDLSNPIPAWAEHGADRKGAVDRGIGPWPHPPIGRRDRGSNHHGEASHSLPVSGRTAG
jgi:phospholipase C